MTAIRRGSGDTGEHDGGPTWRDLEVPRAPATPADRVAQLSGTGRSDHVAVAALGAGSTLGSVDVVLHVMAGRVAELEVFDVDRGEGFPVPVAGLTELTGPTVG